MPPPTASAQARFLTCNAGLESDAPLLWDSQRAQPDIASFDSLLATTILYLIKWKNPKNKESYEYGEDHNTWEPKENLLQEWVLKRADEVKNKALEHYARTGRWI